MFYIFYRNHNSTPLFYYGNTKIFHVKNYYINLMISKIKKLCYNTGNSGDNFVGE